LPGRFGMNRMLRPLTGLGRTLGRTTLGLTLDLASGLARAGEAAADSLAGRDRSPAVLRVRVLILRDGKGVPLTTPEAVQPALNTADRILRQEVGVRVRVASIRTVVEIPPDAALNPRANKALLLDDVLGRTEFYRRHLDTVDTVDAAGPADAARIPDAVRSLLPPVLAVPITVIVVRQIAGNTTGCSLGSSADWVIAQAALFDAANTDSYDETVLVHELGHALNLPHHTDRSNLMAPESSPPDRIRGTRLVGWQRALIQANRHVIPGAVSVTAPDHG